MRRLSACLLAAVTLLAPLGARSTIDGATWTGEPTFISGTWRYDAGEWIYTDFVYDDYGADTTPGGQPNVVSLASTSGDFRYPNGTTSQGNAADIVEVRVQVAPNDQDLEVRALLQSMLNDAVPALQVVANGVTTIITKNNAEVDATANTVSFVLPGAATQDTISLNVGAGLNDGLGGLMAGQTGYAHTNAAAFTTGGPTTARLFDLAFNSKAIEPRGGAWNEDAQSDALQANDLAPYTQTIDVARLRAGTRQDDAGIGTGYMVRIFESRQDLGEGMAAAFPQYRGKWQPYAVWVPANYSPATSRPLFISMHSLSVHYNQYRGGTAPSASYKTFYEQFDAGLGAVVVTPHGRGPDGWYEDQGLVDTLEVWADALKHYNVNPERTYVGGYSMGGYGTYRLSTLMPDSFAAAVSIVGPPANGIWAYPAPPTGGEANPDNTRPQLENTRHVPFWITQGVLDELVPVAGVVNQAQRFAELGHEYRLAVHPGEDHLSFVFKDKWEREIGWLASHELRVTNPQRITFKVRPASWATVRIDGAHSVILDQLSVLAAEIGARLDGAYWVDDVVVAPGADVTASVDLASGAISRRQSGVSRIGPAAGTNGPSPHVLDGQDQVWELGPASDALTGRLSGLTSLKVDVGRAGLSNAPDVSGVTVTGTVTIYFVRDGIVVGQQVISG